MIDKCFFLRRFCEFARPFFKNPKIPRKDANVHIAKEIKVKCRLNSLDALHSAAACLGKASFLLTCDDEILETSNCIETLAAKKGYKLKVRNPIDYLQENGE